MPDDRDGRGRGGEQHLPDEYLSGRLAKGADHPVRALIYARVSHQDSALSDLSIPQQIETCRAECQRQGWEVVGVFRDAGLSAYSDSDGREGFQALIDAARKSHGGSEPVSRIIVDKMDRFSRDEFVNFHYKRQVLPQLGVQLFSIAERIDNSTGSGRTMERIREAMDIGRSEEIARDTMRAMVQNAAEGHVCGGKTPWGYRAVKTPIGTDAHGNQKTRTDWVPDEDAREDVARLFGLLADGVGIHRVAQVMNDESRPSPSGGKWTRTTVYNLARKVYIYTGTYIWNMGHTVERRDEQGKKHRRSLLKDPRTWVRRAEAHEALISPEIARKVRHEFPLQNDSEELYARQQRKLADQRRPEGEREGGHSQPADGVANAARNSRWLLTGLSVCGACGANLMGYRSSRRRKDGTKWLAYRCGHHHRAGGGDCVSYYVPAERFEDAVVKGVADRLVSAMGRREVRKHTEAVVRALRKDADTRLRALQATADEREAQIARVIDLGIGGGLDRDACNERIRSLRTEASDIRDKAQAFEVIVQRADGIGDEVQTLLASADRLVRSWQLLEPAERRERLHDLVSAIVVDVGAPGGDTNTATIHFRGLLEDSGQVRLRIKKGIGASGLRGQENGLQGDSAQEADVSRMVGSPPRTRTRNLPVNSRTLYH